MTATSPSDDWISTRHLQQLLRHAGGLRPVVEALLAEVGLSPAELLHGDGTVPVSQVEALLELAERRFNEPAMGLRLASTLQPAALGVLGLLVQTCDSFGDAIQTVIRFNGLLSSFGETAIEFTPGRVSVKWRCRSGGPRLRRHASEYVLGLFVSFARHLIGDQARPSAVNLPHPSGSNAARSAAEKFFDCPVHYAQPMAEISLDARLLNLPLAHSDPSLRRTLEQHAQTMLEQVPMAPSLPDQVRRLLRDALEHGKPQRELIAEQLGLSGRTLHRHLEDAGTGFQEILEQERLRLAEQTLAHTRLPLKKIADQLGFQSPQTFIRWFRKQRGCTPAAWRAQADTTTPL